MTTKQLFSAGLGYKTRQQIAAEFEISEKTLRAKLKELSINLPRGRVGLKSQKEVYDALGYPLSILKNAYNHI